MIKLVHAMDAHNVKVGAELGRVWGANWSNNDPGRDGVIVRVIDDRRPINGAVTWTISDYGRPNFNSTEFIAYAQDAWRIKRNVLLEYGIRLDGQTRVDTQQVAPRLGLTIDPTGTGQSRIYANWGLYYEFIPAGTFLTGEDTLVQRQYRLTNLPPYKKPRPSLNASPLDTDPNAPILTKADYTGTATLQSTFVQTKDKLISPIVNNWQVGYERRLPGNFKVGATYAGNRGYHRASTIRYSDRDFLSMVGRGSYQGLEINVRRPFTKRLEVSANYTRSRTLGDTASTVTLLQLPYRYATMDWDEPHAGSFLALAEVFGFTVTPLFKFNSGRPYSVTNPLGTGTSVQYVNKDGNPAGRNIYRAPDRWGWDVTITRSIKTERLKFSPTFQILNVTNRVNILGVSSDFYQAGRPTNVADSRQMQFGLTISHGK